MKFTEASGFSYDPIDPLRFDIGWIGIDETVLSVPLPNELQGVFVLQRQCAAENTNQQIQRVKAGKRIVQGYLSSGDFYVTCFAIGALISIPVALEIGRASCRERV